jgi:hypothetical protein
VHASIWRFSGDPDELLGRYEAMIAEIPAENMRGRDGRSWIRTTDLRLIRAAL